MLAKLRFGLLLMMNLLIASCTPLPDDSLPMSELPRPKKQLVEVLDHFIDPESKRNSLSTLPEGKIPHAIKAEFWTTGSLAAVAFAEERFSIPSGITQLKLPEQAFLEAQVDKPIAPEDLKGFEGIAISNAKNAEAILESIKNESFKSLSLKDMPISPPMLDAIQEMKSLDSLILLNVSSDAFSHVKLPRLQSLDSRSNTEDIDLPLLRTSPNLQSLVLKDCKLSEPLIDAIAKMHQLKVLSVNNTDMNDVWLRRVLAECQPKRLELHSCPITDDGLKCLKAQKSLENLNVSRCEISDTALEYIATAPKLRSLDLAYTPIDDRGIEYLTELKHLSIIGLSNTKITEASFPALAKIKSLKSLHVGRIKVTIEKLHWLQSQLKGCSIK
jgi:hypothetical protein